jgi:hypothetical protein
MQWRYPRRGRLTPRRKCAVSVARPGPVNAGRDASVGDSAVYAAWATFAVQAGGSFVKRAELESTLRPLAPEFSAARRDMSRRQRLGAAEPLGLPQGRRTQRRICAVARTSARSPASRQWDYSQDLDSQPNGA